MIPGMNRLAKHNEYLFMQAGAKAYTAKLTLQMLLQLLKPHHCPPNSPELNPVDFGDLGTPGAKCIPRPKDNRSRFLERSHC